ncbi:MAG TPA: 2-phospho-L-lactate guanylyltransferase [Acidimicrobiia bacterium]|jgi:2-phospho-L-lactate guanylyltransferase|nr:2-phospho-L-lactate guanylyltransferase [Acidimicrobiia bacterium]
MVQRSAGVVIPLRSFTHAKARLASALSDDARISLARSMADRVADAAGDRPTVVVTSAPEVVAWAAARSIATIDDPGTLDAAADTGRAWVKSQGLARVVITHADLPYATSLDGVAGDGDNAVAVVVPDHRDDGTPVLALPVDAPFNFSYGPGSAARHITEAARCGLEVRVVRDDALAFDVDIEADLRTLESRRP